MAKESREVLHCHRHPTLPARRRCYHCRLPLCPECQLRLEGHIFCSAECAKAERRRSLLYRLDRLNRTALAGRWFRLLGLVGLIAAGAAIVWFSSRWDRFVEAPEPPLPAFKGVRERGLDQEALNWDAPGAVSISSPAPGEVLQDSLIPVVGTAPPEAMVGLYVNGRKVDVQLAPDGRWRFEGVPLTDRRCLLQARYFDNRGNSSFSPAVLVELGARPATAPVETAVVREIPVNGLNLSRGPADRREVYLTFDGGSNANSTAAILDTLKAEGLQATFFLTGEYMRRYPEMVLRMDREGHVVGNHTYSHPHLTSFSFNGRQGTLSGVTEGFLKSQLARAEDLFRLITGKSFAPYWRAPFGEFNREILGWGAAAGYRHVYWTPKLDTLDWVASPEDPLYRSPRQILEGVLRQAGRGPDGVSGGILLMHLGTERGSAERADSVLPDMIRSLKARGYGFGTVDRAERGGAKPGG